MTLKRFAVVAGIAVVALAADAAPAQAQPVSLRFHDGLVTLKAQNAPLRAILAEWARLGGTTVVNAERVAGAPLTLELNAIPESQALAILLRNVSGYMAATRALGTPGESLYDRILILPTSSAPRNPAPTPGFQPPRPGAVVRPPVIQPDPEPEEDEVPIEEEDSPPPVGPVVRPGVIGARPQPFPMPRPGVVQPDPPESPADDEPQPEPDDATPQTTPANPFGLPAGATSRPGVVTPVPRAPNTPRPAPDQDP